MTSLFDFINYLYYYNCNVYYSEYVVFIIYKNNNNYYLCVGYNYDNIYNDTIKIFFGEQSIIFKVIQEQKYSQKQLTKLKILHNESICEIYQQSQIPTIKLITLAINIYNEQNPLYPLFDKNDDENIVYLLDGFIKSFFRPFFENLKLPSVFIKLIYTETIEFIKELEIIIYKGKNLNKILQKEIKQKQNKINKIKNYFDENYTPNEKENFKEHFKEQVKEYEKLNNEIEDLTKQFIIEKKNICYLYHFNIIINFLKKTIIYKCPYKIKKLNISIIMNEPSAPDEIYEQNIPIAIPITNNNINDLPLVEVNLI